MDLESLKVAEETARWTYWSMIAASVSAVSAFATAVIAFSASRSWRQQERLSQIVRLKRAVFEYRASLERVGSCHNEGMLRDEFIERVLNPARANIFHELALAGLDDKKFEQGQLYNEVFRLHELYKVNEATFMELFKKVIKLQQSIKVKV